MPSFEIIKEHSPTNSFRVASVVDSFSLGSIAINEKFSGSIDIDNIDWNIGVIFGASGTGKTTIAKSLFGLDYCETKKYSSDNILDDMPEECSLSEITKTFSAVGFGSVKSWLKPYSVLSNGEKMRVDLARALLLNRDVVVFDEFTSVVDRDVARIGSMCVCKSIRKSEKKFVAVSCHYDVVDWLEPDWVFNTNDMSFSVCKKKDQKLKLKSMSQTENIGVFLKSIII